LAGETGTQAWGGKSIGGYNLIFIHFARFERRIDLVRSLTKVTFLAVIALLLAGAGRVVRGQVAPATRPSAAAVITLKGEIDNFSRDALLRRFKQAQDRGAGTIILHLDTPGGLALASTDISRFLRAQDPGRTHTIAFVEPMALSGGVMVALACDEIVMAPGSIMGDAAPITLSRGGELKSVGQTERAKMESPILADFYASSVRNGYDPLLTSSMVSVGRVVHYVQNAPGERKFVDDSAYPALLNEGWKPVPGVPNPIDKADTLLTVDAQTALTLGLSKATVASAQALAEARNLNIIATLAPGAGDNLIELLGAPIARGILIVILIQALYLAMAHPGHGLPEVVALLAGGLLLGIPLLTGFATWWEIAIIFIGLGLIALEVFVIPGHGVTGLIGLLLFLGGLVMTFAGSEPSIPGFLPSLRGTWSNIGRGLMTVTAGLVCSIALWFWFQKYLPKLPYFNRLILTATSGDLASLLAERPIETGPAIGEVGVAVSELKPGGSVKFVTDSYPDGRIAAVVSDSGFIEPGERVVVQEVGGNRIVVKKESGD
jgi:membrane-bound serine protease (ClpP class)